MPKFKIPRQRKAWTHGSGGGSSWASASATAIDLMTYVDNPMELTVMRMVGSIGLNNEGATRPSGIEYARFGICIMMQDAYDAMTAAEMPLPFIDHVDWLWTGSIIVPSNFNYNGTDYRAENTSIDIDVKSRRKMPESQSTLVLVGYQDSGCTLGWTCFIRILLSNVGGAADIG